MSRIEVTPNLSEEAFMEACIPLRRNLMNSFWFRVPEHAREDVEQVIWMNLMLGRREWKEGHGATFRSWIMNFAKWRTIDWLRDVAPMSRTLVADINSGAHHPISFASLDALVANDDGTMQMQLELKQSRADESLDARQRLDSLGAYFDTLEPRLRRMAWRRYFESWTLIEIANAEELTESRVSQVLKRIEPKIACVLRRTNVGRRYERNEGRAGTQIKRRGAAASASSVAAG